MIATDNVFKTSINIKFDFGKPDIFRRYLPTASHADSLKGLLNGFVTKDSPKAHMVIGPYGTGKSLIGTIVAGLASQQLSEENTENLIEKYSHVDDEIYTSLKKIRAVKKEFIPVILNGNEGSFRISILSALSSALKENNIEDIVLPGVVNQVFNIINMWKEKYTLTYHTFLDMLKAEGKQLDLWMADLMSYDQNTIQWFNNVYPLLTSGSEFFVDHRDNFIEQIQYIIEQLEVRNKGIFIIYDEFGRFLQTLEKNHLNQTMQDLQDLAELSNHYQNSLHVLLITHRNMRQYASNQNEELQKEFQRIEKRYAIYFIESDENTFVRLSQTVVAQYQLENTNSIIDINNIKNGLLRFPLFPKMNATEIDNLVVYGAYPMHPVTLYLLPRLSNLLAQNERTLFTFLESREKGGLKHHISKSNDWYLAYKLFDFFYPNLSKLSYNEVDEAHIDLYKRLILRLSGVVNKKACLKLIQFMTIWNITGLQSKFKMTEDFISFSLNWSNDEVNSVIKVLQELKVIRFNSVLGQWELFEGSSINIEQLINEKRYETTLSRDLKLDLIKQLLPNKYYFSNEYNNEKSMTRFAEVIPLYSSQFRENEIDLNFIRLRNHADALIINIILEDIDDIKDVETYIKKCKDQHALFCLSRVNNKIIDEDLVNNHIINNLINDPELIKLDPLLKDELVIKKDEIENNINSILQAYSNFNRDLKWYHKGSVKEFLNEYKLSHYLSELMFELYPETPEIRNDSFNRRFINNVQRKAAIKVLDHLLTDYKKENIGLTGYGPDYLIFATTFKNNNLFFDNLNNIQNSHFSLLRERLLGYLKKSTEGSLNDIVSILTDKPFGIRSPLIPLLFLGLLRDEWDKLMLYRNNMYVAEINGEVIYKVFEEAQNYEYRYIRVNRDFDEMFDEIEKLFIKNTEVIIDYQPKSIRISNILLKWLRSLPRITQMTSTVSPEAQKLKQLIKYGEVDPQIMLEQLYELFKLDSYIFKRVKMELEYYNELHYNELGNLILEHFNTDKYQNLIEVIGELDAVTKKNNLVINTILSSNSEDWVDSVAYCLVGVERKNWSDTTNQMFRVQLLNEYRKLKESQKEYGDFVEIQVNGKSKVINEIELSEKSQAIYQNARRLLKNAGRTVPKEEVEYLIWKLLEEALD
jgi:hypothetical protein